ncbi:MAG TPA: hypothetical protein VMB34_06045 [Acetobacteraceae bacterium]|nr:hypothetical protein [Acetobacteraceae bacterium]
MDTEQIAPASEFTRNFGRYQVLARKAAVAVSSHGRVTGYFVAAEEYEAFKRYKGSRRSFATVDLSDAEADAITASRMDPRRDHLNTLLDEE